MLMEEPENQKVRANIKIMAKSYWLINSKGTEVKRFIKNDKSIEGAVSYTHLTLPTTIEV